MNIMKLIENNGYGPLAALKKTFRKQIIAMALIPFLLLATNMQDPQKVFTSFLFWSYVAFCISIILFASYNYRIVKGMQTMDKIVKSNLEQQIALLEKRANIEVMYLRGALIFFAVLIEVLPYFQHYRMLDKWHALPVLVRAGVYTGFFLLQYFLNRRLKERKIGRHLGYLKELVNQMQ